MAISLPEVQPQLASRKHSDYTLQKAQFLFVHAPLDFGVRVKICPWTSTFVPGYTNPVLQETTVSRGGRVAVPTSLGGRRDVNSNMSPDKRGLKPGPNRNSLKPV